MSRPTIHDVACLAGVSLSTIDRVLNGRRGVRQATQARVVEAMRELGFQRNAAAANLARRRRDRLLFLLPAGSNSFMRGLERELVERAEAWEFTAIATRTVPAFDDAALAQALRAVVVHELTPHSRQALLDGSFDAVIHQDPVREISAAVEILQSLIRGRAVTPDAGRIGIEVFLRDNLP